MATNIDVVQKQPRKGEVPAVRMEAVYKYYGEFTALNEIDLKVASGEKIVIGRHEVRRCRDPREAIGGCCGRRRRERPRARPR